MYSTIYTAKYKLYVPNIHVAPLYENQASSQSVTQTLARDFYIIYFSYVEYVVITISVRNYLNPTLLLTAIELVVVEQAGT